MTTATAAVSLPIVVALLALVLLGSAAQRIAGLGFGLVVSPFMVLLLGPYSGVIILNLAAVVSASIIMTRVWRDIDWRRLGLLTVPALLGIAVGSWIASRSDPDWLEVCIGGSLIVMLTVSLVARRLRFTARGVGWPLGLGFTAGGMNALAGIGGPAATVYAVLANWPQRSFAATMQPYFAVMGLASFAAKVAIAPDQLVPLPIWVWVGIVVTLLAGVALGDRLAPRVSPELARRIVIIISYAGGAIAAGRGLAALLLR